MTDLHDLAAPYALDALEDTERAAFEAHLHECDLCRAELVDMSRGVEAIFDFYHEAPPESLRTRTLDEVTSPRAEVIELPRRRRWMAAGAAVAAAAAVILGVYAVGLRSEMAGMEQLNAVLASADATQVQLEGMDGRVVHADGQGVLIVAAMARPADDRTYQMWLIGESGPVSAGLVTPRSGEDEVVAMLEGTTSSGMRVGITEEPAGGSDQPTGEILASADL